MLLPLLLMMGWMGLIFFMSTSFGDWHHSQSIIQNVLSHFVSQPMSGQVLEHINFALRKLAHFSEYALLLTVIYWGFRSRLSFAPKTLMAWVLTFAILFAISDEFHQSFVPGRTSQILDVMIDSAGASLTAIATLLFENHRLKASTPPTNHADS